MMARHTLLQFRSLGCLVSAVFNLVSSLAWQTALRNPIDHDIYFAHKLLLDFIRYFLRTDYSQITKPHKEMTQRSNGMLLYEFANHWIVPCAFFHGQVPFTLLFCSQITSSWILLHTIFFGLVILRFECQSHLSQPRLLSTVFSLFPLWPGRLRYEIIMVFTLLTNCFSIFLSGIF